MSRRTFILLTASAILLGLVRLALEVTIPRSFAPAELRTDALSHVATLQSSHALTPRECAVRYLDFGTDLMDSPAHRVALSRVVSSAEVRAGLVRVTIYNPDAQDDSIYETVDRIYLSRTEERHWVPIRHEWSQKGRGRLGWTTLPTT